MDVPFNNAGLSCKMRTEIIVDFSSWVRSRARMSVTCTASSVLRLAPWLQLVRGVQKFPQFTKYPEGESSLQEATVSQQSASVQLAPWHVIVKLDFNAMLSGTASHKFF